MVMPAKFPWRTRPPDTSVDPKFEPSCVIESGGVFTERVGRAMSSKRVNHMNGRSGQQNGS